MVFSGAKNNQILGNPLRRFGLKKPLSSLHFPHIAPHYWPFGECRLAQHHGHHRPPWPSLDWIRLPPSPPSTTILYFPILKSSELQYIHIYNYMIRCQGEPLYDDAVIQRLTLTYDTRYLTRLPLMAVRSRCMQGKASSRLSHPDATATDALSRA